MSECPCGSSQKYNVCCEAIINGSKKPETAEATMRARYSAFVKVEVDFIESSHIPEAREAFDRDGIKAWSENSKWLGLEILNTEKGVGNDKTGMVEFVAKFEANGEEQEHHEVAEFKKADDFWYFVDGKVVGGSQVVRSMPKVGRNDPCHCGSGKKFKKCCA